MLTVLLPLSATIRRLLLGACVAASAFGCGSGQEPREITNTRIVASPWAGGLPRVSTATRFGFAEASGGGARERGPTTFAHVVPEGWKALPPRMYRQINLLVAGDPAAECYLTVLAGGGGGAVANVNRWRGQMGHAPLAAEEVAKLPRRKLAGLGVEAVWLELEGAYLGMGQQESKPDSKFIGVIFTDQAGDGVFVRMVGPKAVIAPEIRKFEGFLDSLKVARTGGGTGTGTGTTRSEREPPPRIRGEAPPGWREGPAKPMREVTYFVTRDEKTECYVSFAGGGLAENAKRWYRQMEQEPPGEAEVAAFEKVRVLGREGRLLEITGDYQGMGGKKIEGAMMLGVIVPGSRLSMFVKMIGPAGDVRANKDAFMSYVRSLKMEQ